jgi:glycosyltransferase involved in cell wall biosynthesis
MHILTYTDSAGIGGAEISLGHLVKNVSSKIDITVVGTNQLVVDVVADQRPQAKRVVLPATGIKSLPTHLQVLHRLAPDIVHINICTPWECTIGLFAALTLPSSRVVRVDQLPLRTTDAYKLWCTRALSLRVDAHVAVGEASARRMEDFYALGRGTVISIPNCVPSNSFVPSVALDKSNKDLVIGCVGRLDPMKGQDVLIRAIAKLEGVRVIILGEGSQRAALENLASDLGVSDRLSLLGWVNNPHSYLPQFDIFAMPSRSEGFPLAIVEAMLTGLPVVATRVGSVAEAVIDGETGLLVDKDDIAGLATALQKLRDNPALRHQLGQRGLEVAQRNFTVDVMVKRYEQLWSELIKSPQRPRLFIPQPKE